MYPLLGISPFRIRIMKELICPLCSLQLQPNVQGVACANRHQFDRAKEGYFNLLPVHYKNSREPGDAKEQLTARRAFLSAGYFIPLLNELTTLIDPDIRTLLDIGCGEGYFTRGLEAHCKQSDIYGIDISKAGIRLAARNANKRITYAVASSHLLPLADSSMDIILRIYAPSKDQELSRVIARTGKLVIVTPGEQHLIGLRKKIYKEIRPHPEPETPQGFSLLTHIRRSFPLVVPAGEHADSLLGMTPFTWKLLPALRAVLLDKGLDDIADFQISVYEPLK